jgi:hypothetical protein
MSFRLTCLPAQISVQESIKKPRAHVLWNTEGNNTTGMDLVH